MFTLSSSSPWIRKPLSVFVLHNQQQQEYFDANFVINSDPSSTNIVSSNNNNNTETHNHHHPSQSPQQQQQQQQQQQLLHRHLSVWDLIGIGVGGTIGSGIFVLTGQIASQYAGRGTYISFLISGTAAALSGICYAELSGRIPLAGSTYVYAYICLGEWAAIIAASCLTLEYGVAGAAVARTWGDKVVLLWFQHHQHTSTNADNDTSNSDTGWFQPNGIINIPALIVSAISTGLLLMGIKESKRVMNAITLLKMSIVIFMIIGGLLLYNPSAISNQSFTPYGVSGIFRGATTSFFGYLGYDEICCVASEAKHPARDLPRAVLGTLFTVTVCYVCAAIALTGMIPYNDISATAGFPDAFHQRGWEWASYLTGIGELITLPVVVLISFMAQPRLTYSMSVDGLLPSIFSTVDTYGNMVGGTFISGTIMTMIATFVPFTYLDDLISAGILLAFSMTNSCLVLLRCQSPVDHPYLLERLLLTYNALCFGSSMLWSHHWSYVPFQIFVAILLTLITIWCFIHLTRTCHRSNHFGGSIIAEGEYTHDRHHVTTTSHNTSMNCTNTNSVPNIVPPGRTTTTTQHLEYFSTPLVPYLPCLGMAVNWYLIAQLDLTGIFFLLMYLVIISIIYLLYCAPNSIGHVRNWNALGTYESVHMMTSTSTTTTTNQQQRQRSNPYADNTNHNIGDIHYEEGESELRSMSSVSDGMVRSSSVMT